MNYTDSNCFGGIMFGDMYNLALEAHKNQVDKNGKPYFEHPMRVATPFLEAADLEAATVAVGHDLVEDTWVTLGFLEDRFPDVIVDAIDAITRRENETYRQYIRRCCDNDIARRVKRVDVGDNLRPERRFSSSPLERYYKTLAWIDGYELTGKFD